MTGIYPIDQQRGWSRVQLRHIPYCDSAKRNLSEARLSAQSSRLSIRVNAAPADHRASLAGYFEMDFNGTSPGNVALTSTSVGLRLRNAFVEALFNRRFGVVCRRPPESLAKSALPARRDGVGGSADLVRTAAFSSVMCVQHRNTDSRSGSFKPASSRRRYAKCCLHGVVAVNSVKRGEQ